MYVVLVASGDDDTALRFFSELSYGHARLHLSIGLNEWHVHWPMSTYIGSMYEELQHVRAGLGIPC